MNDKEYIETLERVLIYLADIISNQDLGEYIPEKERMIITYAKYHEGICPTASTDKEIEVFEDSL